MEWAKSVSSESDSFERLTRFGQCEMMHLKPLQYNLPDKTYDLDYLNTFSSNFEYNYTVEKYNKRLDI